MSVFGVRKEFSDVNTPKTSISASADRTRSDRPCTVFGRANENYSFNFSAGNGRSQNATKNHYGRPHLVRNTCICCLKNYVWATNSESIHAL